MRPSSSGHDARRLSTTTLAILWPLLLQLTVMVAAESDHKARRKVGIIVFLKLILLFFILN